MSDGSNTELSPVNVRDLTPDVQDENTERSLVDEGTSTISLTDGLANSTERVCNQRTHKGCDVINFERCTDLYTCECLRGYLKDVITEKCIGKFV